ncbi:uncharacterized protein Z518_05783 [Rhinocladiella mackenziei CBS 650.93]|uniref:AAA+ ATPase domain-containing protein n=1 Tax=Rhinocladiella mackenziei CBS 650.93 TaxID=1442369 RepID=A0A0D2FRX7_9EURO|nr:uncharacterized protein Z518_05783 [Rhinocladiella mackenziei CBS 650.93]KIX04912.1 hypothetical protein Z518_05783 [Rhinocladiella mackenziei CBS 650.93]
MPSSSQNLSLSITNPLVLYRALVATKKIKPDPAQHRLALHLQKLYFRLKDYAPEVEYRYRLEKIGRGVGISRHSSARPTTRTQDGAVQGNSAPEEGSTEPPSRSLLSRLSLFRSSPAVSSLALTRTTPLHDSALAINSPLGMLLYGEVGRGKSMLLDLLYNSLPSKKKRRWHFNTFMLDVFRRIELARLERSEVAHHSQFGSRSSIFGLYGSSGISEHEHVVLSLAKDTISESPILFLDEFQMPDRTSSKLINSFFTAFFHLGGVLVASSNRMPEELSKAAGIEFGNQREGSGIGGGLFGLGWGLSRESEGQRAAKTDFGQFLEVLRTRCEVWEMEGERDWRREEYDTEELDASGESIETNTVDRTPISTLSAAVAERSTSASTSSADSPPHYHISLPSSHTSSLTDSSFENDRRLLNPSNTWRPTTLTIYARQLYLPTVYKGILKSTFADLCTTYLGPADYVSLCSTFHTLILTDVPVLTAVKKNEARRFITLLDALYEAKCRLLIEAEAPPDRLFFPEAKVRTRMRTTSTVPDGGGGVLPYTATIRGGGPEGASDIFVDDHDEADSIISESFSEIYQDSMAPFRPNISSYTDNDTRHLISLSPSLSDDPRTNTLSSFTPSLQNPSLRTVLANEDADFGPTYDNGRGHGISNSSTPAHPPMPFATGAGPDFTSTTALTGEDEKFAYKRARSRLWEMCGRRWWDERLPSALPSSSTSPFSTSRREEELQQQQGDSTTKSKSISATTNVNSNDNVDVDVKHGNGTGTNAEWFEGVDGVERWWRPISRDGRFWERFNDDKNQKQNQNPVSDSVTTSTSSYPTSSSSSSSPSSNTPTPNTNLFRHDTLSYRTHEPPPPKFAWYHAWGMMEWGKKAGEWGKGVDGDRVRAQARKKDSDSDSMETNSNTRDEDGDARTGGHHGVGEKKS